MEVHQITLPTGIRRPQCSACRGDLFCRDLRLKHRLQVQNGGQLELTSPSLPQEVIGQGIRTCNITCAHCLQYLNREFKA